MCSSIGRLCDSGASWSARSSLKRSRPGGASSGTYRLIASASAPLERLHQLDVVHRHARRVVVAVAGGEAVGIALVQRVAALLAAGLEQGLEQFVLPAPGDADELRCSSSRTSTCGRGAGAHAHDDQHAGQRRVGELHRELRRLAVQALGQQRLHARAHVGVVVLARHVDQARGEAAEGVAVHEQPRALALAQAQDADRGRVAARRRSIWNSSSRGNCSRMVTSALAVWLRGRKPARSITAVDLAPQQRDVGGLGVVGDRGEQAEEAALADHAGPRRRNA